MLTLKTLQTYLAYYPDIGEWKWKRNYPHSHKAGTQAGYKGESKHDKREWICLLGVKHLAHRLAWFYMTGVWPRYVFHKNGDVSDNRWENLDART